MKYKGKVMFLTSKKAKEWKAGRWKHTYTNFCPKTKQLLCFSGDFLFIIKLLGKPRRITFGRVPKGYLPHITFLKPIYKTKAKLTKVVPRKLGSGIKYTTVSAEESDEEFLRKLKGKDV